MSKTCNISDCKKEVFGSGDKCVLHCDKSDYSHDFNNHGILNEFYYALIDYILENSSVHLSNSESFALDSERFKTLIENEDEEIPNSFNDQTIVFNKIFFPDREGRDNFDYLKVLNKIKGAHFNYCKFTARSISIPDVKAFYQDCEFHDYWGINQSKILGNVSNVLYQCCVFKGDVSIDLEDKDNPELDFQLFNDCVFEKELSFRNVKLKRKIFNSTHGKPVQVQDLIIENCEVSDNFILNELCADNVLIKNSEFQSRVELKDSKIKSIDFIDNNFIGLFDSSGTMFGKFNCFKNIFNEYVSFENCEFAKPNGKSLFEVSIFKYVTFSNFSNFRNSVFYNGLDFESTNLKSAPNFLNIKLLFNNTNRETYRIIKDSFDKIGNHIEANRFYVLEMKKYKQELATQPLSQEKIIFWLNEKVSGFGSSFIRPIIWIIVTSIIYCMLILGHESNLLYRLMPSANNYLSSFSAICNGLADNIIPFKKMLREGMEFLSLLFYVLYASLIWQTIAAIKRHTRR